ncbi:hypothetical protein BJX70DRAFT_251349 [Aspergillus crustosus]
MSAMYVSVLSIASRTNGYWYRISNCRKSTGIESMGYTDYTEECCRAIAQAANNPIDLYPVRPVRFQWLTDTMSRAVSCTQINVPGYPSPPLLSIVKALEAELEQLRPPLPAIISL